MGFGRRPRCPSRDKRQVSMGWWKSAVGSLFAEGRSIGTAGGEKSLDGMSEVSPSSEHER
jgi:hypothetical protein